jgi:hypothetical protein
MSADDFCTLLVTISRHLGLPKPPPEFYLWSLYGDDSPNSLDHKDTLEKQIKMIQPDLVIIDPLRAFFPMAETKSNEASAIFAFQKHLSQRYDCSWVNLHHIRKQDTKAPVLPDLINRPMDWFQQVAGSRALVNHTDLRLGIEAASSQSGADLIVNGYRRGAGPLAAMQLGRVYDDEEKPVGYKLLTGLSTIKWDYQVVFNKLSSSFKFMNVKQLLGGTSDSAASGCLDAFKRAEIVRSEGENKNKVYYKTAQ